jgi:hypothetical protein
MADDLIRPNSTLDKYFFTPLYYPRGPLDVIWWWERRRLTYNLTVGAAGLLSLITMVTLSPAPPSVMRDFGFLLGAGIYGVLANGCYTLGWVVDLAFRRLLGIRAPDVAPVLLRYGFVFSVGLSLLPIPVVIVGRIMMALFGPASPH